MTLPLKKLSIWILAALIALFAVGVGFMGFRSRGSSRLDQAREDAARGASLSAIKQYLGHLDESPEDHCARLELAELLKPRDSEAALVQLEKIPASTPEYPAAIRHIAHIAIVGKRNDLAEDAKVFWRERFFTSAYCVEDHPIFGAARFLGDLYGIGGQIA